MTSAVLRLAVALGLLALGLACERASGPPPVAPGPGPEGVCQSFCAKMHGMKCLGASGSPGSDEELGTPDDVGCVRVCLNAASLYGPGDQACIDQATTCERVEFCLMGE